MGVLALGSDSGFDIQPGDEERVATYAALLELAAKGLTISHTECLLTLAIFNKRICLRARPDAKRQQEENRTGECSGLQRQSALSQNSLIGGRDSRTS